MRVRFPLGAQKNYQNMNYQEILKVLISVGKIKKVKRSGWVKRGVKDAESVADHSYRMAMMAIMLANKLSLNSEKLIKMALIHDVAEGVTSDIIWEQGTNIIGNHEEKTLFERKVMKEIFKESEDLYLLWEEFEKQTTREAKILKCIDKLEMLIQAGEYEKAEENTESLQEFWNNVEKYLVGSELEDFFDEIKLFFK